MELYDIAWYYVVSMILHGMVLYGITWQYPLGSIDHVIMIKSEYFENVLLGFNLIGAF